MADVEVRTLKEVDLKGGTVVAAFPSIGLVSTITATYMITNLKTDQVVALESPDFPSLSMIYAKKPKFPARVYASQDPKIAIFICEMPLPMWTHRPVAYALLKWAKDHGCRWVVPLEGLPAEPRLDIPDARAAVALVHTLDLLLPEIEIDLKPLQAQAKALEDHLSKLKQQAAAVVAPEPIPSEMYR